MSPKRLLTLVHSSSQLANFLGLSVDIQDVVVSSVVVHGQTVQPGTYQMGWLVQRPMLK